MRLFVCVHACVRVYEYVRMHTCAYMCVRACVLTRVCVSDLVFARNCSVARMLPGEAESGVGMNRSARGGKMCEAL